MNTETKELMDMNSDLFEELEKSEKEKFEELPDNLKGLAEQELGDKDKTTVKDPSSPLFMWAEMREVQKRLDRLEEKIDRVFGDHVLVNGRWIDVSNAKTKNEGS